MVISPSACPPGPVAFSGDGGGVRRDWSERALWCTERLAVRNKKLYMEAGLDTLRSGWGPPRTPADAHDHAKDPQLMLMMRGRGLE